MADIAELMEQARRAQQRARAPYSHYPVGAALLARSGKVYLGCNVESGAYPTTMCAERIAIYGAIAAGETEFEALVVVTNNEGTPCGACRQVIFEQCGEIPIYLAGPDTREPKKYFTSQLLPDPFDNPNV